MRCNDRRTYAYQDTRMMLTSAGHVGFSLIDETTHRQLRNPTSPPISRVSISSTHSRMFRHNNHSHRCICYLATIPTLSAYLYLATSFLTASTYFFCASSGLKSLNSAHLLYFALPCGAITVSLYPPQQLFRRTREALLTLRSNMPGLVAASCFSPLPCLKRP
jgi:hypothetical protein